MQQQTVTLIGHLTAEPFYREFDTGRKFARFRLGTSRRAMLLDGPQQPLANEPGLRFPRLGRA